MKQHKEIVLALLAVIFIAVGSLAVIDKKEKATVKEPLTIQEEPLGAKEVKEIKGDYNLMTKNEKTELKAEFKNKLIKNGKLQQGVLTLNEANLLLTILSEEYSNTTIENVQGNVLFNLINNLK